MFQFANQLGYSDVNPFEVVRHVKPRCGGRRAGFYYDRYGNRYQAAEVPQKFYDYNF